MEQCVENNIYLGIMIECEHIFKLKKKFFPFVPLNPLIPFKNKSALIPPVLKTWLRPLDLNMMKYVENIHICS